MKLTKTTTSIISLLFICLTCLLAIAVIIVAVGIPVQAEKDFGKPNPDLSGWQKIFFSARLYGYVNDLTEPRDQAAGERSFGVAMGESAGEIASRLEVEGIIRSAKAFRYYLLYSGKDTSIQAGVYQLSPAVSALEIAQALQDSTPSEVLFTVLKGWRLEEIASTMPTSGFNITAEEFLSMTKYPAGIPLPDEAPSGRGLEGYLMPGSYELDRTMSGDALIGFLVEQYFAQVSTEMWEGFTRQGLTFDEAVILASIVQREAVVEDEQPMIASVFLNRLSIGMKLETDPTVQYALGYQEDRGSWWKSPLGLDDLAFDNPYNTYLYQGLPPGPICNPGLPALRAVAFPAQSPYYFFRAKCDGSGRHFFAVTFDEHLNNACK